MIFLYLLCIVVGVIIDYVIAKKFEEIAEMKGHEGHTYFWFTFLFGIIGMLMVIALPNQKVPTVSTLPEKKAIPITIDSVPSPKTTINETKNTSNAQCEAVAVARSDGHITCPKCGLVQKNNRTVCWDCGQKFWD